MPKGFLSGNIILDLGITAWFLAQLIKCVLELLFQRKLTPRTLVSSGGMPSSHSSFVCAMSVGSGRFCGWGSPLFALATGLAAVVMYDACNVRRAAGENTRMLNSLLGQLGELGHLTPEGALKEILGHTPLQVLVGALLGCGVGFFVPA